MTVASAHDVEREIRYRLPEANITQVHKWLYFVQGWHVSWTGRPAFRERIVAWDNGPVVADLWHDEDKHRGVPPPTELPEDVVITVEYVLARYGRLSARELVQLTHEEGPWQDVYTGRRVPQQEITTDALASWFASDVQDFELRNLAREVAARHALTTLAAVTTVERDTPVVDETAELERMLAELA